jgi:hypothetical protein
MATTVTSTATTVTSSDTPTYITTRPDSDILAMGRNLVLHGTPNQTTEPENAPAPDIITIDQEQMELEADSL